MNKKKAKQNKQLKARKQKETTRLKMTLERAMKKRQRAAIW